MKEQHKDGTNEKISNVEDFQARFKEAEISHRNFMIQLRREYDDRVKDLHDDFKRRFQELTVNSDRMIKLIREEKEAEMRADESRINEDKERQTREVEKKCEEVS